MSDEQALAVSKSRTRRGVPWSEVTVGELPGMVEDGIKAAALLKAMEAGHAREDRS